MSLPGIFLDIIEGSARPAAAGASKALVIGPSKSGIKENKIYTFANPSDIEAEIGLGPATTAAQMILSQAPSGFGNVDMIVCSSSLTQSNDVVLSDSDAVIVSTASADNYDVMLEITSAGSRGEAKFRFSLDGGSTYSPSYTTVASYPLAAHGVTFTFADVSYTTGLKARTRIQAAAPNATDLAACFAVLETQSTTPTLILVATPSDDPEANEPLFATLDTALTNLKNVYKYTSAVLPGGGETKLWNMPQGEEDGTYDKDDVIGEFSTTAASEGNFISVVAEKVRTSIPLPKIGYSRPRLPFAFTVATELHRLANDHSSLLPRSIAYVSDPSYDDFANGTVYHPEFLIAPRSWPGEANLAVNQALLKSAEGSTFDVWPKGKVTNVAANAARVALRRFVNTRVRVNPDGTGTIDARDAATIEATVNSALNDVLVTVLNGQGNPGHVSAIGFFVNRNNNILTTGLLQGTLAIVPLAYVKNIQATISLELELPVQAA